MAVDRDEWSSSSVQLVNEVYHGTEQSSLHHFSESNDLSYKPKLLYYHLMRP